LIEVILWDLDGTIHDSESLGKEGTSYGFRQVLGREPTEDEFAQLVGRPIPLVYKEWFDEDLANRILDVGTRYYQERADQIPCYTDVPELLIELKRCGYRMGVVSSKRKFHVVNELKSKALDSLFDVIIAQEDTSLHKPYPDPLLVAASHLKCQPENCIYIGDQPSDIQAAHAAGMKSIGALWGDGKLHRLEPISPTMLAHTPKDILDFIAENSLKKHSWTLVDDLEKFDLGDSEAYAGEWRNMKALHINKAGVAAFLKEAVPFQSFRLQAYVAIPEEVGFIGLVFGARDSSNYELIYLSPGNTEGIGEIQYDPVMNGSTTWQIYNGPNYLTHTPYTVGEWVQFTVDVHQHLGLLARIYSRSFYCGATYPKSS
jgi:pyrophosphatase PpaX